MKYYSEEEMKTIRKYVEENVLKWEGTSTRKMFGCPSYKVNGNLFGFLVTGGIVITNLPEESKAEIFQKFEAVPFQAGNRTVKKWVQIPIKRDDSLADVFPYLRQSYKNAKSG